VEVPKFSTRGGERKIVLRLSFPHMSHTMLLSFNLKRISLESGNFHKVHERVTSCPKGFLATDLSLDTFDILEKRVDREKMLEYGKET